MTSATFPRKMRFSVNFLLTSGVLLLAILSAAAIAVVGPIAGIMIGALLLGSVLLFFPRVTVWTVVVGALGVAGLVELYFPNLQAIRWGFALLSVCLAAISLVQWLGRRTTPVAWETGTRSLTVTLGLFASSLVLAALAGQMDVTGAAIGLKNYLQMWGLIFALAWLGYKPVDAKRFIVFLGWLALVQMPFVLHQYLVLVPMRSGAADAARNIVAVDIVAGTFGGNMAGGGRSPDLALLAVIAVTLFFAQWKFGDRTLKSTLFLSALAFTPILLNEAKLALVLLPVGLLVLFRKSIFTRPLHSFLGITSLAGVLALVVAGYAHLPGADGQRSSSIAEFVDDSLAYNVGNKGYGSAVLNRSTVYPFWLSEHTKSGNALTALLGHGPGFSNSTAIRKGDNPATARYLGYAIGLSGISTLLWDTGVVGTSLLALALLFSYRLASNLACRWHGTVHEPILETVKVGVILLGLSLFHNDYVAFDIGYQTMFAVLWGYLFAMARPHSGDAR